MTEISQEVIESRPPKRKLTEIMAERFNIDPAEFLNILKKTAFRTDKDITREQCIWLLVICHEYRLNPFLKQIFAFVDYSNGGAVIPVVGVDGWLRIANEKEGYDGMEIKESETLVTGDNHTPCPEWIECTVFKKGREHAATVRERFAECFKPNKPDKKANHWTTHTSRALRHKAIIQSIRVAFNMSGIYDEDEATNIIDVTSRGEAKVMGASGFAGRVAALSAPVASEFDLATVLDDRVTVMAAQMHEGADHSIEAD
jgi:phage recombination protein Bet